MRLRTFGCLLPLVVGCNPAEPELSQPEGEKLSTALNQKVDELDRDYGFSETLSLRGKFGQRILINTEKRKEPITQEIEKSFHIDRIERFLEKDIQNQLEPILNKMGEHFHCEKTLWKVEMGMECVEGFNTNWKCQNTPIKSDKEWFFAAREIVYIPVEITDPSAPTLTPVLAASDIHEFERGTLTGGFTIHLVCIATNFEL